MEQLCKGKKPNAWSLADLARESGVSVKLIYKYAEGSVDKPGPKRRKLLAGALGVTEEFLFYGTGDTGPNFPRVVLLTMNEIGTLRKAQSPRSVWDEVSYVYAPMKKGQILSESAFAFEVKDRACDPDYKVGDQVICEPVVAPPEPGKFVVAQVDGLSDGVLRRYQPLSMTDTSTFKLIANDRFYPDIVVDAEHPGHLVGRVVKLVRDSN